jgi:hypothetical protein
MVLTRMFPLPAAAVACLMFGAYAHAEPADMSLQLTYEVEWGDVDVATATADWIFTEDSFALTATSRTVGVTDSFRKYRGRTELSGRIEEGRYLPERLFISGVSRRRTREASTRWEQGVGAIATDRQPALDAEKVFPLTEEAMAGAIDPFSAMLNALARLRETGSCEGVARIYDGLRTSELTLHDLGRTRLAKDRPFAYEGEARLCGFVSEPTGGHQRESRWRRKETKPEDIMVFIAEVQPDLLIPVRIEARTFLGTVVTRLVVPDLQVSDL